MTATTATKTLKTKTAPGYVTDEGQAVPAHTLYRFEDEDGKGGCWYASIERAETSWQRWIAGAPGRARRAAEHARLTAAAAGYDTGEIDTFPFTRL